jgi:hypothetical protein
VSGRSIGYLGIWVLGWFRDNAFSCTSRAVALSALAFLMVRYGKSWVPFTVESKALQRAYEYMVLSY